MSCASNAFGLILVSAAVAVTQGDSEFVITCNFNEYPWPLTFRVLADMCQKYYRELSTSEAKRRGAYLTRDNFENSVPTFGKVRSCPLAPMRNYLLSIYGRANVTLTCLQVLTKEIFHEFLYPWYEISNKWSHIEFNDSSTLPGSQNLPPQDLKCSRIIRRCVKWLYRRQARNLLYDKDGKSVTNKYQHPYRYALKLLSSAFPDRISRTTTASMSTLREEINTSHRVVTTVSPNESNKVNVTTTTCLVFVVILYVKSE